MIRKPLVYIAGPITKPCPLLNARNGMAIFDLLLESGLCIPYCPHWSVYHQIHSPKSHEQWLQYDFQVILRCDAVFRLPGESVGADAEEEFCDEHGIPVFDTMESLSAFCETWTKAEVAREYRPELDPG